ncbi:hypothetical protein V6U71_17680 [Sphingopyxis sp. J-6]|uniref:hypothetical protein n=1 Tax=Sphingopyxis sp. J-6 TaxID=3122054 RepID=UPI0039844FC9
MKPVERAVRTKWLRCAALLLLLAITPFCWLVARDAILLLRFGDSMSEDEAHWLLADRFANTINESKISARMLKPLYLTIFREPSCFVLRGAKLLPSDTPAAPSDFRGGRQPSLNNILLEHGLLAELFVEQNIHKKAVSEGFSGSEMVLFNACLAATPFAGACETRVSKRLDASYRKVSDEVLTTFGIIARRADAQDRYCYILPEVSQADDLPRP